MFRQNGRLRITFNAPVVLTYCALCAVALIINVLTGGAGNRALFSTYRSGLTDPLTYARLFGHVLGHSGFDHLIGNVMLLLILGPMLEEKYGSLRLLQVILLTALATALVHALFSPHTAILGASSVVFAMMLLASVTGATAGEIPVTLLLVAALYLASQLWQAFSVGGDVAYLAHIVGGFVGALCGLALRPKTIK